jgi:1,4-dihydroxy-6-naphthoate synthase
MPTPRPLVVRCSPDADDLYMFRALLEGLIDPGPFDWAITTLDTDALNRDAVTHPPDVTAISVGHYPALQDQWQLLPHGGSVGDGYGPVVVAREPLKPEDLQGLRIAVPGLTTTAYLVLCLILGEAFRPLVTPITPYHRIFDAIDSGEVDAGLVIHEGRLNFREHGLHQVLDIGAWWKSETGLPLPLGANAIRRDLGAETIAAASPILRESIRHAQEHKTEGIAWIMDRGSALRSSDDVSRYLDMYANHETLAYSDAALEGMRVLFERAAAAGLVDVPVRLDLAP